ncbi:PREDICTED: uncharacterized protein LOC107168491 [Diuraphis noxia]|uniref:uncharacterized protein LOC107168491 n=1 Tax=Diuraphis noxia TaxID=143948 RepID=UPI0007636979|nr:PREDICTED: uncharacterized protein LOC107168491 [Diuraphis noxia]
MSITMKFVILLVIGCTVLNLIECNPVEIVSLTNKRDDSGQFLSRYKLDDGTGEEKMGKLQSNNNGEDAILVQRGSYTTNVDGRLITYNWIADTRGFRISKA